jgi:hypothetical protein
MKNLTRLTVVAAAAFTAVISKAEQPTPVTFQDDLNFLKKHVKVIVLSDKSGDAQVALVPAYQGRIMTSTAGGDNGLSFGWVNRELIASGKVQPHINVYGGEDRFWLGPEGGQFSIFFAKSAKFDLEHWFTPASLDTEPFETVKSTKTSAIFKRAMQLTNYTGTKFDLEVGRQVKLLGRGEIAKALGTKPGKSVKSVGIESINIVKNTGNAAWKKDTGLLSIWILGMFNASPSTTAVIPFKTGPEDKLGPIVNDTYFGKVPAERLVVKDGVLFFAADAKYRSKIGISPRRTKDTLGSYDAQNKVLTIAQYTLPEGVTDYVNSMWELQKNPFSGDTVNSYNDNGQLGKFYELETSSPALALAPGESAKHIHRTIHLQGDEADLDPIARKVLGVSLAEIKSALKR